MIDFVQQKGFILNFLGIWAIAFGLSKSASILTSFGARFMAVAMYGIVLLCHAVLMEWNWMHTPTHFLHGMLIDYIVITLLLSTWLAWWFGRGQKA